MAFADAHLTKDSPDYWEMQLRTFLRGRRCVEESSHRRIPTECKTCCALCVFSILQLTITRQGVHERRDRYLNEWRRLDDTFQAKFRSMFATPTTWPGDTCWLALRSKQATRVAACEVESLKTAGHRTSRTYVQLSPQKTERLTVDAVKKRTARHNRWPTDDKGKLEGFAERSPLLLSHWTTRKPLFCWKPGGFSRRRLQLVSRPSGDESSVVP